MLLTALRKPPAGIAASICRLSSRSCSLLPAEQPDISSADQIGHHQQYQRHRCGISEIKKTKCRSIDVQTHSLSREARPAFCKDVDLIENPQQIHRAKQER